jgi:predicted PhzF superfamily epimerase YddE/YHI9
LTPGLLQVKICGHATLAAAHTLFTSSLLNSNVIEFVTVSGTLTARKVPEIQTTDDLNIQNRESQESFLIELDFPTIPMIDFNSAEFSSISNALNGASVIDIKRTTTEDDLIVMCPSLA